MSNNYFNTELDFFMNINKLLLPEFQRWYDKSFEIAEKSKCNWQSRKSQLYSDLVLSGEFSPKWKSESYLFTIVKGLYSDAIFQYSPKWIKPQSIDIFIPQLKLAIEYQGAQHSQSVDFFGGEDGYKDNIRRDLLKKDKCMQNNIQLIEWNYDEKITIDLLKSKIQNLKNDL